MRQIQEHLIRVGFQLTPTTKLRAIFLRKLGAYVGKNCRIHQIEFMNMKDGFSRLHISDNCYIGPGVLLDLAGTLLIAQGSVVSARTIILTHNDAGSSHGSPLCETYPASKHTTSIGPYAWLGAGSIVTAGAKIGQQCVLGAGSVALGDLQDFHVYAGQPATIRKKLPSASSAKNSRTSIKDTGPQKGHTGP